MTMPQVRPSRLPLAFDCPSSLISATAPVRAHSDYSDLGTAAHKALAQIVSRGETEIITVAREYSVDVDDLAPLVDFGRKAWAQIGRYFPGVQIEIPIDSDLGPGIVDLLSRDVREDASQNDALTLGDWKSGRSRRQYRRQMQGYAEAARQSFGMPKSERITAIVIWLRFAEIEVMQFTADDLDAFRHDFFALEQRIGKDYAPGEHCQNCPRENECLARDAFVRSAQTALVAANTEGITPAKLAEFYPQTKVIERALKNYHTALKLYIVANGPLSIGDGKQLELIETRRSVVDPRVARRVLVANGFTEDDISRTLTMSKTEIETIAGEYAPRGDKGRQQATIVRALADAGAITTISFTQLHQTKEK